MGPYLAIIIVCVPQYTVWYGIGFGPFGGWVGEAVLV